MWAWMSICHFFFSIILSLFLFGFCCFTPLFIFTSLWGIHLCKSCSGFCSHYLCVIFLFPFAQFSSISISFLMYFFLSLIHSSTLPSLQLFLITRLVIFFSTLFVFPFLPSIFSSFVSSSMRSSFPFGSPRSVSRVSLPVSYSRLVRSSACQSNKIPRHTTPPRRDLHQWTDSQVNTPRHAGNGGGKKTEMSYQLTWPQKKSSVMLSKSQLVYCQLKVTTRCFESEHDSTNVRKSLTVWPRK